MGEIATSQNSRRWQIALDPRFFDLMRWEVRHLRGRGQFGWQFVLTLLFLGIVAAAWWIADLPERWSNQILLLRVGVDAAALSTPLRNEAPHLGQLTFGYALLRYALYGITVCARLIVPAIAAGSVAGDRKSGRMAELKMMPVAPWMAFLARTLAPALPFLALTLLLPVVLAGPLISEAVPVAEVARLLLEACGQILLATLVALTCSTLFLSPWAARSMAYVLLWLVLPLLWAIVLRVAGAEEFGNVFLFHNDLPTYAGYGIICIAQATLTGAVCLAAFLVGVRRYRSIGAN